MQDIHGNMIYVGDNIYILDAATGGSQSKRLLYGIVTKVTSGKCQVYVYENERTYSKTSATIIKPME
jgi:hypothetical protein